MKQHKIPFRKFYLGGIYETLADWRHEITQHFLRPLFGLWFCSGCGKHHGPRTIKYKKMMPVTVGTIFGDVKVISQAYVCSKHAEEDSSE